MYEEIDPVSHRFIHEYIPKTILQPKETFYSTKTTEDIGDYIPEKMNNPYILSIYIGTHGKIYPDLPILKTPPGINLIKQNVSGLNACSIYKRLDEPVKIKNAHIIALSLLKDFYISYNETQYLSTQQVCKNRVFSVTNMDNSCEQFNNPNGWIQKKYTYKSQIPACAFSIAYMDMSFEFLHSTLDQFKEFISKLKIPDEVKLDRTIFNFHMEQLYNRIMNKNKTFFTSDIFLLLYLFKRYYNVHTAHMLDESCNRIFTPDNSVPTTFKLPNRIGYGGKKSKKTKRKLK